jgi:hypothetical protein
LSEVAVFVAGRPDAAAATIAETRRMRSIIVGEIEVFYLGAREWRRVSKESIDAKSIVWLIASRSCAEAVLAGVSECK